MYCASGGGSSRIDTNTIPACSWQASGTSPGLWQTTSSRNVSRSVIDVSLPCRSYFQEWNGQMKRMRLPRSARTRRLPRWLQTL